MTNPAEMDREELIALLACGELDREAPEIAKRLAEDEELAREVEELEAIALAIGDSCRTDIASEDSVNQVEEERVLSGFRQQIAPEPSHEAHGEHEVEAPQPGLSPSISILIRLAAVVAFLLIGRAALMQGPIEQEPAVGPSTTYLGDGRIEIPEDFPFGTLRWKLDEQFFFFPRVDVKVYAVNGNGLRGALLADLVEVEGAVVQLTPEQLEGVRFLLYEIEVRDDGSAQPQRLDVQQRR